MAERKMYNTTLDTALLRKLKILAAQMDKRQNDLLEEAIQDLLKKYGEKAKEWGVVRSKSEGLGREMELGSKPTFCIDFPIDDR